MNRAPNHSTLSNSCAPQREPVAAGCRGWAVEKPALEPAALVALPKCRTWPIQPAPRGTSVGRFLPVNFARSVTARVSRLAGRFFGRAA